MTGFRARKSLQAEATIQDVGLKPGLADCDPEVIDKGYRAEHFALDRVADNQDNNICALFGLRFDDRRLDDVASSIVNSAARGERRNVFFVNAHCINIARKNETYFNLLRHEDRVYADGIGMFIAGMMAGNPLKRNVNGTDLFPYLCKELEARRVPIAFLGARPGVVDRCVKNLRKTYPQLNVVWQQHGYLSAREEAKALRDLSESGAKLLFVAKGVPAQELWIKRHEESLSIPVMLGVGALFDFYSHSVARAPLLVRRMRMEWAFRLMREPRRLFRRYVLGNPEFLFRVAVSRLRGTLRTAEWRGML